MTGAVPVQFLLDAKNRQSWKAPIPALFPDLSETFGGKDENNHCVQFYDAKLQKEIALGKYTFFSA